MTMNIPPGVRRWAFYDFANSSYVLIYSAYLLPIFFATKLMELGYSLSSWGWATGISTVLGVILSIMIGRIADRRSRYRICWMTVIAAFVGMVAVAFSVQYFVQYLYILFVITNSIFIASVSLSDSILPFVSSKKNSYYYSGFAWGWGYIGGVISLIMVLILQKLTHEYSPLVFLSVAVFYIIFSFYSLSGLKHVPLNEENAHPQPSRLSRREKGILFLGYWLISECITVIILFFSIYGNQELHLSPMLMGGLLLSVQLIAFPAVWYGGYLTRYYRPIFLLGITIVCWGITIGLLVTQTSLWSFVAVVFFGGLAIGNSQSFLRAQYSNLISRSEAGFQFGIYSLVSQASVFIGPIVYGYASDALGSQKLPLIGLFVLMVVGYGLLRTVVKKVDPEEQCSSK